MFIGLYSKGLFGIIHFESNRIKLVTEEQKIKIISNDFLYI
jgi:hypothetical protein